MAHINAQTVVILEAGEAGGQGTPVVFNPSTLRFLPPAEGQSPVWHLVGFDVSAGSDRSIPFDRIGGWQPYAIVYPEGPEGSPHEDAADMRTPEPAETPGEGTPETPPANV